MKPKKIVLFKAGILLLSLLLLPGMAGCGAISNPMATPTPTATPTPPPLTDEEFAEIARQACSNLKTEMASLDPFILFDLASKSDAYRRAADALAELEITEQSAPNGTRLRSGLTELANLFDMVDRALSEAIAKADLDGPVTRIAITEDGRVYASAGSIFEFTPLDIDATLIEELLSTQEQVREAAVSLNLEDCAIGD